ncbi:hypothetical protein OHA21_11150 [Actinoplanes sp. NBC_00393]|uniref:hypothetical protein n=1 Tax=Actinoplanes sp. NBC_00393 TaxID=2975953 RepID=UPI002E1F0BAE
MNVPVAGGPSASYRFTLYRAAHAAALAQVEQQSHAGAGQRLQERLGGEPVDADRGGYGTSTG